MNVLSGVVVAASLVTSLAFAPVAGHAETLKKNYRSAHTSQRILMPPPEIRGVLDQSGGNAAAGGNNANSMSGSNSAAENANGRTSGGGYGGN